MVICPMGIVITNSSSEPGTELIVCLVVIIDTSKLFNSILLDPFFLLMISTSIGPLKFDSVHMIHAPFMISKF